MSLSRRFYDAIRNNEKAERFARVSCLVSLAVRVSLGERAKNGGTGVGLDIGSASRLHSTNLFRRELCPRGSPRLGRIKNNYREPSIPTRRIEAAQSASAVANISRRLPRFVVYHRRTTTRVPGGPNAGNGGPVRSGIIVIEKYNPRDTIVLRVNSPL